MSKAYEELGAIVEKVRLSPMQTAFVERLGLLRDSSVYELPRFDEVVSHNGTTLPKESRVGYELDGIQLSRAVLEVFGGTPETFPNTFEFEVGPPLSMLGRDDSHHSVFAGTITMRSRPDARGETIEYRATVAVKPFLFADARFAAQECGVGQFLTAQGVGAHDVIAVIANRTEPKQPLYVLTRWRPELHSLDSYYNWKDWSQVGPGEVHDLVRERVQPVVDTFVAMHTHFVFNSDGVFRNVVVPDRYGDVFVSDLEHATSCRDIIAALGRSSVLPDILVASMYQDISAVQRSFKDYIYDNAPAALVPATDADKLAFELECFIEPYWVALEKSGSPYTDLLLHVLNEVIRLKRQEAGLPEQ